MVVNNEILDMGIQKINYFDMEVVNNVGLQIAIVVD